MSPQPFLPGILPQLPDRVVREQLASAGIDSTVTPALLGLRGFYGDNARNRYDDALFLATPLGVQAFNANTDPSRRGGHIAVLEPGVYAYKVGTHHPNAPMQQNVGGPGQRPCLVQAGDVTVRRDDGVVETGEFYIHFHDGGYTMTSSAGCQTLPPEQWPRFFSQVQRALLASGLPSIPYYLTAFTSP